MNNSDRQISYWDKAASNKTFTHPVPIPVLKKHAPVSSCILDYGCGYGRTCLELMRAGYHNVTGIDISNEMINRGITMDHTLDLRVFDGISTDFDDHSFDVCLLIAVLTCVPSNEGQMEIIGEIRRVLKPGGILFVSDYPLQKDTRNIKRYREQENKTSLYGVFGTEGGVFRHHSSDWIGQILEPFTVFRNDSVKVKTMNGHESDVFQMWAYKGLGKK